MINNLCLISCLFLLNYTCAQFSKKQLTKNVAHRLQAASHTASIENWLIAMNDINKSLKDIKNLEQRYVVGSTACLMAETINCKHKKHINSLFYLWCVQNNHHLENYYKPKKQKKAQRLYALAHYSERKKVSIVEKAFDKQPQRGKAHSLIESGTFDHIVLLKAVQASLHYTSLCKKFYKDLQSVSLNDLTATCSALQAWKAKIKTENMGNYSLYPVADYCALNIEPQDTLNMLIDYDVINFTTGLQEYVMQFFKFKHITRHYLKAYIDWYYESNIDQRLTLFFLSERYYTSFQPYELLCTTLYYYFKHYHELWNNLLISLIRTRCQSSQDYDELKKELLLFVCNKFVYLKTNKRSLSQLQNYLQSMHQFFNNNSFPDMHYDSLLLNVLKSQSFYYYPKDNLVQLLVSSSYWYYLIDIPQLLDETTFEVLDDIVEMLNNCSEQTDEQTIKINQLIVCINNALHKRLTTNNKF